MTHQSPLRIAVTGDYGADVLYYESPVRGSSRPDATYRAPAHRVIDMLVPSGAEYVHAMLEILLGGPATDSGIQVISLLEKPTSCCWPDGTQSRSILTLHPFRRRNEPRNPAFRIADIEPYCPPRLPHNTRLSHDRVPILDHAHDTSQSTAESDSGSLSYFKDPGPDDHPTTVPADNSECDRWSEMAAADADVLFVHYVPLDMDQQAGESKEARMWHTKVARQINAFAARRDPRKQIFVNIGRMLPPLRAASDNGSARDLIEIASDVWHSLLRARESVQITVLCSSADLRHAGAAISRWVSWEQAIEDLCFDLRHYERLASIAQFSRLIVRFGHVAAMCVEGSGTGRTAHFTFAPETHNGSFRSKQADGRIVGTTTIMAASLMRQLGDAHGAQPGVKQSARELGAALGRGLAATMAAFNAGYPELTPDSHDGRQLLLLNAKTRLGRSSELVTDDSIPERLSAAWLIRQPLNSCALADVPKEGQFGTILIPERVLHTSPEIGAETPSVWQIFRDQINGSSAYLNATSPHPGNRPALVSRINIGIAIVKYGLRHVLNVHFDEKSTTRPWEKEIADTLRRRECLLATEEARDCTTLPKHSLPNVPALSSISIPQQFEARPIFTHVLTVGNLITIEREEIEGIRGIRSLIIEYVSRSAISSSVMRPLSIAVFGPPGAGKSFVVKQIAKDINDSRRDGAPELVPVEFNISQFSTPEDVGHALLQVGSTNNRGEIPLVFFDEFDCPRANQPLGWLQLFLAPMQDGVFLWTRTPLNLGRAVFIFAGGIHARFSEFDPTTERRSAYVEHGLSAAYSERLSAFRSAKGTDFVSRLRGHIDIAPFNTRAGETKHIVRRAIMLRSILERRMLLSPRTQQDSPRMAHMDDDLLYALLTLDNYKHGARSMEAVIDMCTPIDNWIEKASLPPRAQLDMHVSAAELHIRLFRGRARGQLE